MIVHAPPASLRTGSSGLCAGFDPALLSRIEDAGLNASAPPQQRLLGGWVLRLSPGKAKRARCVNALAVGRLPLAELLGRAQTAFECAGLPFIVRITPFTQPPSLDSTLHAMGFKAFDDTRVMVRLNLDDVPEPALPPGCELETPGHGIFADAVGSLRASPMAQRLAHAERLRESPTVYSGLLLKRDGRLLACGQFALEDELVGLYDVFTTAAERRGGMATALCVALLRLARGHGARTAYLQVDADNHAARRLYARLGFIDGYAYHYRGKAPEQA